MTGLGCSLDQKDSERQPEPHRALHPRDTLEIGGGTGETALFSRWHRTGTGESPGAFTAHDTKATQQPPHSTNFHQPHSF